MDACQLHALWLYLGEHYWHCLWNSTKCVPAESEHTYLGYSKASASPRRPINTRQEGPTELYWVSTSWWTPPASTEVYGGTRSAWVDGGGGERAKRPSTRLISVRGAASLSIDQVSYTHITTCTHWTITKLFYSVNNTNKPLCKHRRDNRCCISLLGV